MQPIAACGSDYKFNQRAPCFRGFKGKWLFSRQIFLEIFKNKFDSLPIQS